MSIHKKYNFDLLVILGATATGKTRLAVKIADKLNLHPQEFLRKNDKRYKELNLSAILL